mmetsp:Transcript_3188/g.8812  ORF Transcript_3188/g.8812 Transcript_3188/m.8812 type:complete len:204 (-) Transcript_3188:1975-2586(-)
MLGVGQRIVVVGRLAPLARVLGMVDGKDAESQLGIGFEQPDGGGRSQNQETCGVALCAPELAEVSGGVGFVFDLGPEPDRLLGRFWGPVLLESLPQDLNGSIVSPAAPEEPGGCLDEFHVQAGLCIGVGVSGAALHPARRAAAGSSPGQERATGSGLLQEPVGDHLVDTDRSTGDPVVASVLQEDDSHLRGTFPGRSIGQGSL